MNVDITASYDFVTVKEHLSLQGKTFCQSACSFSSPDASISLMWQVKLASKLVLGGGISHAFSPLDSPAREAFVYVNFPAEQAASADLLSPQMKHLKIDPALP